MIKAEDMRGLGFVQTDPNTMTRHSTFGNQRCVRMLILNTHYSVTITETKGYTDLVNLYVKAESLRNIREIEAYVGKRFPQFLL